MYEAPIELVTMQSDMMMNIQRKLAEEQDTYIMQSIEKVGVNVNKEELIKALAYDREQYVKGYADGMKEFAERVKQLPSVTNCEYEWTYLDIDNLLAELTPEPLTKIEHSSLCETETYEGVTDTNVGGKKNDLKE